MAIFAVRNLDSYWGYIPSNACRKLGLLFSPVRHDGIGLRRCMPR